MEATRVALSVAEAAAAAGLSRTVLYQRIRSGDGPLTFKVGRRRLVSVESLKCWIARQEQDANCEGAHDARRT